MRHNKRTDANQKPVVEELIERGYVVKITSHIGFGFPDMLICKNGSKKVIGVELKDKGKRNDLTDFEVEMHGWLNHLEEVIVAESANEIIKRYS